MAQVLQLEYPDIDYRNRSVDNFERHDLSRRDHTSAIEQDMADTLKSIVEQHGGMIARIASSYEARPEIAEDLVQDALLAIWRALPKFRGDANPKTYAARIAHNVCISHVRKASRRKTEALDERLPDAGLSPDDAADKAIQRERLLAAIRQLSLSNRQLITLHLEGFSNVEIAETLGQTANNIGVRLSRARAELKDFFGDASND